MNPGTLVSDAGKRFAEAHNLARFTGGERRWIAVRLSDGGTDGVLYDDMDAARSHQLHETQCYYCCVQPGHMTDREASRLLEVARQVYDSGGRFISPDAVMPRVGVVDHDFRRMLSRGLLGIAEPTT